MPPVPNRAAEDRALTAAMLLLFDQYRSEAQSLLASSPNASAIPASFYTRLTSDMEAAALTHLERVSAEAADRLAVTLGVPQSEAARTEAKNWAQSRAAELASQFVERTREWIAEIIAKAKAGAETAAVAAVAAVAGMATVFSPGRASSLGVTETTEAASAGEMNAARQIERDYRVKVVAYWEVDESSNVCPICSRCHGQPQEFWERVYPNGPPGHPHCACSLRFQVLGSLPRFSEN